MTTEQAGVPDSGVTAILSDEEVLRRRDHDVFSAGFDAGCEWANTAAPELLAALKTVVDHCLSHILNFEDWQDYEDARAAIAKAKGKSVPA